MLAVQTNNATYTGGGQSEQQLAMARIRAVEFGRSTVVAATNGISAQYLPDGAQIGLLPERSAGFLVADLPLSDSVSVAALAAVVIALVASLALRTPFKVDIVRDRATLARLVDGNQIENVYRIQVMNATEKPQTFQIAVEDLTGLQIVSDKSVTVDGAQSLWVPVQLRLPYGSAKSGSHTIQFRVASPGVGEVREKSIFMVPR